MIWHIANTTVRSPFRLRGGLSLILEHNLQGALRGEEAERNFCRALAEKELVHLREDATYSIGRKWRSALAQMGFLYPKLDKKLSDIQAKLGQPDYVTENGLRLVRAETVFEWQECFLRSLAANYIPSIIEPDYTFDIFSPLRHTLAIMRYLQNTSGEPWITFQEMALFVQVIIPAQKIEDIGNTIIEYRKRRETEPKRPLFNGLQRPLAERLKLEPATLLDYADVNLRYIKATGLVVARGKGIILNTNKMVLIDRLIEDVTPSSTYTLEYLSNLCSGSKLPTDEVDGAAAVLHGLVDQLAHYGIQHDFDKAILNSAADMAIERHSIEHRLREIKEKEYASEQASKVQEIIAYLDLLCNKRKASSTSDEEDEGFIEIPKGEAPAYFEWSIWRAFLAINSLINQPWESRRFQVDDKFLPVAPAPGGGSDLLFEFSDFVLVVEVTLTSSSRQEAAEGESVRRHVAKYVEQFNGKGKQVFGLFLAVDIDTNTANTFRLGEWYLKDDKRLDLHIVPLKLSDFIGLLKFAQEEPSTLLPHLKELLRNCRMHINKSAPEWKAEISILAQRSIADALSSKSQI
jgi:AlwI restriction endonuclease